MQGNNVSFGRSFALCWAELPQFMLRVACWLLISVFFSLRFGFYIFSSLISFRYVSKINDIHNIHISDKNQNMKVRFLSWRANQMVSPDKHTGKSETLYSPIVQIVARYIQTSSWWFFFLLDGFGWFCSRHRNLYE